METTKTPINRRNEQIVFDSHYGTLLSNEKGWGTDKCNNMGKFQKHYAKQKKLGIKDCTLHNFIYMIFYISNL